MQQVKLAVELAAKAFLFREKRSPKKGTGEGAPVPYVAALLRRGDPIGRAGWQFYSSRMKGYLKSCGG